MPKWLGQIGVKTRYIAPGSPWENGYDESSTGSLRGEIRNGEIFYSLAEAKVLIEAWRRNLIRSVRAAALATDHLPRKELPHIRPPVPLRSTSARRWQRHA